MRKCKKPASLLLVLCLLLPMLAATGFGASTLNRNNPELPVQLAEVLIAEPFWVPEIPAGVHPRLYLRDEDLEYQRSRRLEEFGNENVLRWFRGDGGASNPDKFYWQFVLNNHPDADPAIAILADNLNNFAAAPIWPIQAKAYMYLLDKDSEDEEAAEQALQWGREAVQMAADFIRTYNTTNTANHYNRTNQMSQLFQTVAIVYSWCYDLIFEELTTADEERGSTFDTEGLETFQEVMLAGFQFHAQRFGYPPHFPTMFGANEDGLLSMGSMNGHDLEDALWGIMTVAIAVYDEDPAFWEEITDFFFNRYFPTKNYMGESGMNWNGSFYGTQRSKHSAHVNYLLFAMQDPAEGRKSVLTYDIVDIYRTDIYYRRPDGRSVRIGDTTAALAAGRKEGGTGLRSIEGYMFVNAVFHCPFIQNELESLVPGWGPSPVMAFLLWSGVEPQKFCGNLPLSVLMVGPNSAEMVARTGWPSTGSDMFDTIWDDDWNVDFESRAMHVNARFGVNTRNHDHLDAGSFMIYYRGALAVDGGSYQSGFGTLHDDEWHRSSISHNTIVIRDPNYPAKFADAILVPEDSALTAEEILHGGTAIAHPANSSAFPGHDWFNTNWNHPLANDYEAELFLWRERILANTGGQLNSFGGSRAANSPRDIFRDPGTDKIMYRNADGTVVEIDGPDSLWLTSRPVSAAVEPGTLEPAYTYLKGDMTELYGYRAEEVTRSFLFFNFKDDTYPGALIVFDRIETSGAHEDHLDYEKFWLLHSLTAPTVNRRANGTIENFVITDQRVIAGPPGYNPNAQGMEWPQQYNGQLVATPLLPHANNLSYTLQEGYGWDEHGYAFPSAVGAGDEAGRFMVMLSPAARTSSTTHMLNVLQAQDAGEKPLNVALIGAEGDAMVGAKITGQGADGFIGYVAMFSARSGLVSDRVVIPAAGTEASLNYYITDLAPGNWRVFDANGHYRAAFSVAEGENIGAFALPANDAYVLIPQGAAFGGIALRVTLGSHNYLVNNSVFFIFNAPIFMNGELMIPVAAFERIAARRLDSLLEEAGIVPQIVWSTRMVPLRKVSELLGLKVAWSDAANTVILYR
jgi:hypothetical protein